MLVMLRSQKNLTEQQINRNNFKEMINQLINQ